MLRLKAGWTGYKSRSDMHVVYLPDFMLYDLDDKEYENFWLSIIKHPREQLYSDGLQIYQVSWVSSIFERLKGWLGFQNHCQTNVVELGLAKIAYYGYLKGFSAKDLESQSPPLISKRFVDTIKLPRNDDNSLTLQNLLTNYFFTYSIHFTSTVTSKLKGYKFGQAFFGEQLYDLIPALDPQDPQIIEQTINILGYNGISLNSRDAFLKSAFAEGYAEAYYKKGNLKKALEWSETICSRYKEPFIDYFLQSSEDRVKVIQAVKLIVELAATKTEKALNYLRGKFTFNAQLRYLEPYTDLKKKLAMTYLQDAIKEKNRTSLAKYLSGSNTIPLLAHAVQLDPHVLDNDCSMQDILVKEEWMVYKFNDAMKSKLRFAEGREVYEKNPHFKYDKHSLQILRGEYLAEINKKEKLIAGTLVEKNTASAEKIALEAVALAQLASGISPQNDPLLKAQVIYAATLHKIDVITNGDPQKANISQLDKALGILEQYTAHSKNAEYIATKNLLLERKIDGLIEKIKSPDELEGWKQRNEWAEAHKTEINELQHIINTYISFNSQNKSKEVMTSLAKMHFILGDVLHLFLDKKDQAVEHFASAAQLRPNNPYYQLYYLDFIEDSRRFDARQTVQEMGDFNERHYQDWLIERWVSNKILSKGFDIHGIELEPKSLLSWILG